MDSPPPPSPQCASPRGAAPLGSGGFLRLLFIALFGCLLNPPSGCSTLLSFYFYTPPPPPPSEQTEQESERSACSPLGARPPRSPWIAPERSVATVPQILLSPQFLFDRLGLRERHRLSCSRGSSRRGLTRWHLFGCDFFAVDPRAKRGMLRGIAPAGPNRVCREEQTAFRLGASPRAGGGGMRKT